jgi:uracil-DNA glycosylase family 4
MVCPLKAEHSHLKHPDMKPSGTMKPTVYMLGESPSADDDKSGRPFAGAAGRVLKMRIPEKWDAKLRWNNVVRTRTPKDAPPSAVAMECCRPSVVRDVELTKPDAIFGFGNIPLEWVIGQQGITKWAGRRLPVKIGSHTCWFFPLLEPRKVLESRRYEPRGLEYGSDIEFQFAKDLERAFRAVEDGLPEPVVHTRDDAMEGVEWVTGDGRGDLDRVVSFIRSLYDSALVGFDYECNGVRPYRKGAAIQTLAMSCEKRGTLAFPLRHSEAGWTSKQLDSIEDALEDFFYEAECVKAVHSLAFEMEWTAYFYGRKSIRAQPWECTLSQAFILDERQNALSLEHLSIEYFGINLKKLSSVDRKNIADEPLEKILPYNGMDAKYHRLLCVEQGARLIREKLTTVYREHLRRIPTAVLTSMRGVPVDQKRVSKFADDYNGALDAIEDEIADLPIVKQFKARTGKAFRPSANDDAKFIIQRMLGQHVDSVDKVALRGVKHEFVDLLLEWRENNKLLSTYVEPCLPDAEDMYPDGLFHPILHTTKTRTWRTSSDQPNIQNWPKRQHKEVRGQVHPGGDYRVVSFDFAGIQARNVAMESRDKALVRAFRDRYDIHSDWLGRMEKLVPKWKHRSIDYKTKRNIAKNGFVFPSFFGARPKKISTVCEIDESIAQRLQEEFWDEFPDVKGWHERLKKDYYRLGYVTGLSGFRRRAPVSPNELINAPIQADEAIIVCDAMARLSEMEVWDLQPNLMVHDDLTFLWDLKNVEKNAEIVIKTMLDCPYSWAHIVPLGVEMSIGRDWAKQEGAGEYYSDQDKIIVQREKII